MNDPPLSERVRQVNEQRETIRQHYHQARAAWPDIQLTEEVFVESVCERISADVQHWLDGFHTLDYYLALACARGVERAVEGFETRYFRDIQKIIGRFVSTTYSEEDLTQIVMEKLFVGKRGKPPKIAEYSGQGFLQNWLRVTVVRTCIDVIKGEKQRRREIASSDDFLEAVESTNVGLELDFLKRRYRQVFRQAFEAALRSLQVEDRNLLRQHLVHRLNIDQIGSIYGVHRATAARRLQRAKQALLALTREHLSDMLDTSPDEFDSIMNLIASNLDLSIRSLLRSTRIPAEPDPQR